MPKLQPLRVPWKISPSAPYVGVSSNSIAGINQAVVSFGGFFGLGPLHAQYGVDGRVEVTLHNVVGIRLYPEFSADDAARLESYDWESIPEFRGHDGSCSGHASRFHDEWNSTGICPNPAAYIVEDSDWLAQLHYRPDGPARLRFQHYLFIGDDYNVEVIAQSLTWAVRYVKEGDNANDFLSLLCCMAQRPAMYVGTCSLLAVSNYLAGYDHASAAGDGKPAPPHFDGWMRWVESRFMIFNPAWHWTRILLHHYGSDRAAIEALPQLYEEFLACRARLGVDGIELEHSDRFRGADGSSVFPAPSKTWTVDPQ